MHWRRDRVAGYPSCGMGMPPIGSLLLWSPEYSEGQLNETNLPDSVASVSVQSDPSLKVASRGVLLLAMQALGLGAVTDCLSERCCLRYLAGSLSCRPRCATAVHITATPNGAEIAVASRRGQKMAAAGWRNETATQ